MLTVAGKDELQFPLAHLTPELLGHQRFDIGFVIDDQNSRHAHLRTSEIMIES